MIRRSLLQNIRRSLAPARESDAARIPLPPEEMQLGVGKATADHYLEVGHTLWEDIRSRTDVQPTDSILDIGCGSGRLARHFANYVQRPGRYMGMDIQKSYVDWCQDNISAANPAFAFYHQDIYNGHYNPEGKYEASEYRFPFEDDSFDLIILTSVFTHLLPEDASNYLREVSRLLKPDGYCYSTWFLLGHDVEVKYLVPDVREAQVGYGFRYCVDFLERCGLTLAREPSLGAWRGEGGPIGQDVLVLGPSSNEVDRPSFQHETATVSDKDLQDSQKIRGTLRSIDPVRHSVSLMVEKQSRTFRIAEKAVIRANGRDANSSVLREGQGIALDSVQSSEGGQSIAVAIEARDRPQAELAKGRIESIDLKRGTITLHSGGKYTTFEMDPSIAKIRVNGELTNVSDLKEGQRASLQYIPKTISLGAVDGPRKHDR
jgi:SAM-dependent methyltransferase